jgi:hypothetical protein
LVTLLAFIAFRDLKPYFMLEMLMGFTSQSFLPGLKPQPFRALIASLRLVLGCFHFLLRDESKTNKPLLRSFTP